MDSRTASLLACLVSLAFVGCETSNRFIVNAMNAPQPLGNTRTFSLAAAEAAPAEESLIFKEMSRYMETALLAEGFRAAAPRTEPDLIIELDFDVSEPKTQVFERQEPVYINYPDRHVRRVVYVRNPDGSKTRKVVYAFRPGRRTLVGWDDELYTKTVYDKYLTIRAYASITQSDGTERSQEVWNVEVSNTNDNGDLRYFLPRMVATAMPYFDADTQQLQTIDLKDSDPDLLLVLSQPTI